ncbi:MAG: hypothetical protein KDA38_05515, partial [Planctomycetales bacterium]|nr:hypothetical protein [Planctomycetales bacterium]
LRYEKTTKPNLAIRNYVSFSSSSFVIAVLGVLASWLARRVDQFRPFPGEGFVGSVRFLIIGWVIVVATAVLPGLASLRMSVTLDSPMRAMESVESSAEEPESTGLLPAAK